MVKITYVHPTGSVHEVEAQIGQSVMEAAIHNLVPGIDADCGGACACATCHVYVREDWRDAVGPASEMELSMLDFAAEPRENSRLSCQISVRAELDGLTVDLPEVQG